MLFFRNVTQKLDMKNYKLEAHCGEMFSQVAKKAKELSIEKNMVVEFDFNGIQCLVDKNTVLDWLDRDYSNGFVMDWKTIGPDCKMTYDYDTEIELRTRQLEKAKRYKLQAEEQAKKDQLEKENIENRTNGISLDIIVDKEQEYAEYVTKNSNDGYSKAVIEYSEAWAKLMQVEISSGKTIIECAETTQKGLGYFGISGFQYGCVVQGLTHFWKHGEDLRKWHNKEYGVGEDKKGVVNPAILTLPQ
jgi:hypothetical protein